MSEDTKLKPDPQGKLFYVIVDDPNAVRGGPATAERSNAPRPSIVYINRGAGQDPETGERIREMCLSLDPSPGPSGGVYTLDPNHKFFDKQKKAMDEHVKGYRWPIIGPFKSMQEAIEERAKIQPLTEKQELAKLRAEARRLEEMEAENKKLSSQLAAMQQGTGRRGRSNDDD